MSAGLSERKRFMLAALATGRGLSFAPVQVQKLFFLLDENVADAIGGRKFTFVPYHYGPFDKTIYRELESLHTEGLVNVERSDQMAGRRRYSLTPQGQQIGEAELRLLPSGVQDYMRTVIGWIKSLSFSQLVGSIYKAYPRMRVNSVFQS